MAGPGGGGGGGRNKQDRPAGFIQENYERREIDGVPAIRNDHKINPNARGEKACAKSRHSVFKYYGVNLRYYLSTAIMY